MKSVLQSFFSFYEKKYVWFTLIPLLLLVFSAGGIFYQMATHDGEIINKGISLSGGLSITVETDKIIDVPVIESELSESLSSSQVRIRTLQDQGQIQGYVFQSNMDESFRDSFVEEISAELSLTDEPITIEVTQSSLGAAFFSQVIQGIFFALILMGCVVYVAFRKWIPALAIIFAVIIDLVVTLTVFDLSGQYLSAAGVAAFLMIIGYAVDTNILLSSRMLKSGEEDLNERLFSAAKTGMFMTITTITTMIVALVFTNSEVISQIMFILLIGLGVDFITTWFLNAGILRWYVLKQQPHTVSNKKKKRSRR